MSQTQNYPDFLRRLDSDPQESFAGFYRFAWAQLDQTPPGPMRGLSTHEHTELKNEIIYHCVRHDFRVLRRFRMRGESFAGWLYVVSHRVALGYLRSRGRTYHPELKREGAEPDADRSSDHRKLIPVEGQGGTPDFVRPGEHAIEVYLLGTAGSTDRARVLDALSASEPFRQEITAMMKDLESLATTTSRVPATSAEAPPDFREFAGAFESAHRVPFFGSRYLQALAALLLLAFGASQLKRFDVLQEQPDKQVETSVWQLVTSRVDAGRLMDIHPRGSGSTRPESFEQPPDAALDHFRFRLQAKGGRFELRDRQHASLADGEPGPPLELVKPDGGSLGRLETRLVRGESTISPGAALWALAIPSRNLYRFDLKGEIRSLVAPEAGSEFTLYTLVTPKGHQYVATTVHQVSR